MAIEIKDYAKLPVFYQARLLKEVTSVKMSTDPNSAPLVTLNEGYVGQSHGAGNVTIEVDFVIPIDGLERPYQQDAGTGRFVTMQLGVGRVGYIGRGQVVSCEIQQSVNASAGGTFKWVGQLKELE